MTSRQLPVLKNQLMKSNMSMRDPKKSKKAKNTEVLGCVRYNLRIQSAQISKQITKDI